jgi:predicted MFS family arabinose efflux permease
MSESQSYPRAIVVFVVCQALTTTCAALIITTTALVGRMLAPDAGLSTIPLAIQYLSLMATTRCASWVMGRWGRRVGFSLGAACGVVGGTLASLAIGHQNFVVFAVGAGLSGSFLAFGMHYRFAAADTVPPARQSRVISWVMAGGVLAAVAGPQLANWSRDLFAPVDFAGVYAVLAALCALQLVVLQMAVLPAPGGQAGHDQESERTARDRRPAGFVPAVLCGMVAYGGMNLVMAVTPTAMADCGLGFGAAAFVIQWHVFAMYAPSFVTGHVIAWLGLQTVLMTGVALMVLAAAINVAGLDLANFAVGLICLGVGWNLLFVGATTWLTRLQTAGTTTRLQGINDMFVFGAVAVTSLSSGWLLDTFGWTAVNMALLPALAVALIAILRHRQRLDVGVLRTS